MATQIWLTPSVLLVSDVLEEREMYARTLRASGYRVIEAETSVAAYQIATTRHPDIIVTDVRLTGSGSGLELTRWVRNEQRALALGIIVLTTVSRPQDADVALKAGADRVLKKPVPASVLEGEIARLLVTSRQLSSESPPQRQRSPRVGALTRGAKATTHLTSEGTCPWCNSKLIWRERWPLLNSDFAPPTVYRERLRYAAGWFCTNPMCDYRQLSDDTASDVSSGAGFRSRS